MAFWKTVGAILLQDCLQDNDHLGDDPVALAIVIINCYYLAIKSVLCKKKTVCGDATLAPPYSL